MKNKHALVPLAIVLATITTGFAKNPPNPEMPVDPPGDRNKVQLAILLDTSNSMDGLIDQAKTQLWKVVNTFVDARRNGRAPFVEVALYEYGNNNLHVGNHYIRQVEPFTRDLDEISRELFALKTNGGEEYCGAVIQRALADLAWEEDMTTYKVIFIAGNEPFTQGPVDPRQACRDAIGRGVVVNTIHCGGRDEGMSGSWHDGAALAGGKFMIIDQDRAVAHIPAPQDKPIADLGIELNKTYLGYGKMWKEAAAKQTAADRDAAANEQAGAPVQRAVTKASGNYSNSGWDLVDAVREEKIDPATLESGALPEAMRGLKPEERAAYIDQAARERAEIQQKIAELNREREKFVAEQRKRQNPAGARTLDEAMIEATREQASALGYHFGN